MEKKRKILNTVMVLAIVIIIGCGIAIVGNIRGWFSSEEEIAQSRIKVTEKIGNANIERKGVGYTLKEDTALEPGDIVETLSGSTLRLKIDKKNTVTLNEKTEINVKESEAGKIYLEVNKGEVFVNAEDDFPSDNYFKIAFDKNQIPVSNTAFSLGVVKGTQTINVLDGSITYKENDKDKTLEKGQLLSIIQKEKGKTEYSKGKIVVEGLNEFLIGEIRSANEKRDLAIENKTLDKVLAQREKEKREAEAAASASDAAIIEAGNEKKVETSEKGNMPNLDNSSKKVYTANITIRCDTILKNMKLLTPGKGKFVPPNGVILSTSAVQFYEGETVFDVLKRVCNYTNIQLEYSWTPLYDSYYIEGINHLYEFDCGDPGNDQSGWMYKVNGWFPNYGCSSYELKNGDNIVWCYTCHGLGSDVGCEFMQ